jgi:hypothetical protein
MFLKRGSPLLGPRRGGRDINKNAAKPPLLERTGWLVQLPIIRWLNQPPRLRRLLRLRDI